MPSSIPMKMIVVSRCARMGSLSEAYREDASFPLVIGSSDRNEVSFAVTQTQRSVDRDEIAAIEQLIRPYVRHTPIITIDARDFGLDSSPFALKLEFLQHTGSFKPRGAFANLMTRPAPAVGVAAASGGNHGAAVAYAAMRLGIRATIFVPRITSPAKMERIRGYGAELVVVGDRYADALAASEDFVARTGALDIH